MIYEVRTYTVKPGTVADYEARFEKRYSSWEKYHKGGAFWHTEIGPLNQVIQVIGYDDLNQHAGAHEEARKDPYQGLPYARDFAVGQESEIVIPASFMHPLGSRDYGTGNIYEMRTYTYEAGGIAHVLKAWEQAIPYREEYSPLAACWYTMFGVRNKFTHVWVYKDLIERARIRAEASQSPHWPPKTAVTPVRQENKILKPASFSPVK